MSTDPLRSAAKGGTRTPSSGGAVLLRSLRRQRALSITGAVFLGLWQLSEALVPVAIGLIIDHAVLPVDLRALVVGLLGLIALFIVLSYSYRFGSRSLNKAAQQEAHAIRVEVAAHALTRSAAHELVPGEVMSRSTADADEATRLFGQLGTGASAIAGLLGAAGYLLVTDWLVGALVLLIAPVISVLVTRSGQGISARSAAQQAAVAEAGARAGDIVGGFRVLKALGGEEWANRRYHEASRTSAHAAIRTASATGKVAGISELSVALTLAAVLLLSGWRVIEGDLGAGQLIAIVGVAVYLSEPVRLLGNSIADGSVAHGAADRVAHFLNGERSPHSGDATVTAGDVVLSNPHLVIPAGTFCVINPGNSTTRSRLVEALTGRETGATIDSRPAADFTIGPDGGLLVAPHDADVFEGTVRSNITMSHNSGAGVDNSVLEASAALEVVTAAPEGLDHLTREAGSNLSGGERQRLALARALHADPQVLVLDDPTSAVDSVTDYDIARGVHAQRRTRTTIVLSSSPAFHEVADLSIQL